MELFIRLLVIKQHRDWFNNVPVWLAVCLALRDFGGNDGLGGISGVAASCSAWLGGRHHFGEWESWGHSRLSPVGQQDTAALPGAFRSVRADFGRRGSWRRPLLPIRGTPDGRSLARKPPVKAGQFSTCTVALVPVKLAVVG